MATDDTSSLVDFSSILPASGQLEQIVQQYLQDDMPSGMDVGGLVVGTTQRTAKLWMKSAGVVAGQPFVNIIFQNVLKDCTVHWHIQEGKVVNANFGNVHVATVFGPVNKLLQGERTALNILSRCSGVASAAKDNVSQAHALGWKGWVAGTRKTTPGFRLIEKYGLLVGGAATHRLDLSQMVMLKDNHIWSAGSITKAVELAKKATGFSQKIEVECQSLDEALEAAKAGADIVMLDNMQGGILKDHAATIKQQYPHVLIEASGGITSETMSEYLCEYVDIISQGKLTQGYSCVDYSLKIVPPDQEEESSK